MIKSSRWSRGPLQGHGSHLIACDRVDLNCSAASHINHRRVVAFASSQREIAKCKAHQLMKPRKEEPRLARRRNGEESKERPSHKGRTVLGQMAGVTNDLSQHAIKNDRNARVRCSKIKRMFVSGWCKLENWFLHSVPAIQNAADCEQVLSAGTMKESSASREFCGQTFPRRCKTPSNFSILKGFRQADSDFGTGIEKRAISCINVYFHP